MTTLAPPPPPPAPALSPGGRSALRVVLVVVAAVAVVSTVAALTVAAVALSTFRVITDTQALPKNVASLTVDTGDVPVAVRITSDDDATEPHVDLRMVASAEGQRLGVTNDAAGSRVTLGGDVPAYLHWARAAELKVVLPEETARELRLTVQQQIGYLSTDADLGQLIVNGINGAVHLGGSAQRMEVHVRNGDIRTRSPIAVTESFLADIDSGDLSLQFRTAPRTLEAASKDGDVSVALPGPGPYRVRAESAGRHDDTTVSVPETSDPSAPQVTARSNDGDVEVSLLR